MSADRRLPRGEPILIPCEGSGTRTPHHLCPMCGSAEPVGADGSVAEHERDDVLARLARGDFG